MSEGKERKDVINALLLRNLIAESNYLDIASASGAIGPFSKSGDWGTWQSIAGDPGTEPWLELRLSELSTSPDVLSSLDEFFERKGKRVENDDSFYVDLKDFIEELRRISNIYKDKKLEEVANTLEITSRGRKAIVIKGNVTLIIVYV